MTRILLIGARLCRNLGGPSLLLATREVLNRVLEEAEYTYVTRDREDLELAEAFGLEVVQGVVGKDLLIAAALWRCFRITVGSAATRNLLQAYRNSTLVIDIWGIGFSDALGPDTFRSRVLSGTRLLIGKILGKRVVKYTADLGPFEGRWNRLFSRFYLQCTVDLIFARSEATAERLRRLGIRTPVRVLPDTAFLLETRRTGLSDSLGEQSQDRPIVGLSVSHMAARQSGDWNRYIEVMAQFADDVIARVGARIVIIPNELSAVEEEDDVQVARAALDRMEADADTTLVDAAHYSAEELKGIIGACDVVVAARYHTIVASLSQGVPVLAIGWHDKYEGVMGLFGLTEYVISVDKLDGENLQTAFQHFWDQRKDIAVRIAQNLPQVQDVVLKGGDLVKGLLLRET